MSVSTTAVAQTYNGDGATSIFPYPNYLFEPGDLIVTSTLAGVTTAYALNADPGFDFSGVADAYGAFPTGGDVAIVDGNGNPNPPAAGALVMVTRVTPKTQLISFIDDNAFPATTLEHGLDKACLWAQEEFLLLGLAAGLPATPGTQIGQIYLNAAAAAGGFVGWVWDGANWDEFGTISL